MHDNSIKYQKAVLQYWKLWLAMLRQLPSVAFWGLKVIELTEQTCSVKIPFTWRTQNPFRSIYFGALSGAAELSTGILCQMLIKGKGDFSMLVTGFRAEFVKKATTDVIFTCDQGLQLATVLDKMPNNGDTGNLEMVAIGKNSQGEIIGRAYISWSFKRKSTSL